MTEFFQQLINGLALGSIIALIALGYTMVYGILRFINFAHGDIFMLGAFAGLYLNTLLVKFVQIHPDADVGMAIFAPLALTGMVWSGLSIYIFRRLNKNQTGPKPATALFFMIAAGSAWVAMKFFLFIVKFICSLVGLNNFTLPWTALATLLGAMAICAALGVLIERFAYRPLRKRPKLTVLITAIGVSLLIEYAGQFFFGAAPKKFPDILPVTTMTHIGGLSLNSNQLMVLGVTLFLLLALRFIVLKTRMGTAMRAVAFNPEAAALMGVNTDVVISFTFALGSALAAAAGILWAINYPAIDPLMGILPGLKAFIAAVLGGIGNLPGAALGGLVIGIVETFVKGTRWSTWADAISFAILILILLVKPSGLLGKKEIEKV